MAILKKEGSHTRSVLRARHLIGRSSLAHLILPEPNVSGEHAVLCWVEDHWEAHDLGSRNGTFLDGVRLETGTRTRLSQGAILELGGPGNRWCLIDDAPPSLMAMPVDDATGHEGEPLYAEGGFLALPDASEPIATIYQDRNGFWVIEDKAGVERIKSGTDVMAGERRFTVYVPEHLPPTWEPGSAQPSIDRIGLCFAVSRDEEHVQLTATVGPRRIDLGARAHHYLLLTLARARLRDREAGEPPDAQGWIYQEELSQMLDLDSKHLNVTVFRCRQHLGAAGILGAADIVERRRLTQQLRLGVEQIHIENI